MPDTSTRASARVRINWIIVFVIYAIVLLTATHWPKPLLLDAPLHSDKIIHFCAFLLWTLLLGASGLSKSLRGTLPILASVALCYAFLDELTQGIPGINRHVSAGDLLANITGVLVGLLILARIARR